MSVSPLVSASLFFVRRRQERPLLDRERLSLEQETQCRIIGGNLIAWLQKHGPRLLQERALTAGSLAGEDNPFIVFTSDLPGLVAAGEILADGPATIATLYPDELAEWLARHPDPEYRWHVHTWSFFAPLDAEAARKAREHPIGPEECYWLHTEGTMGGRLFGRGDDHLWKWNGHEPVLLVEGINKWVS